MILLTLVQRCPVALAPRTFMAVRPFFLPTAPRGMCSTAHGGRESAWPVVTMAISMFLRFAGHQGILLHENSLDMVNHVNIRSASNFNHRVGRGSKKVADIFPWGVSFDYIVLLYIYCFFMSWMIASCSPANDLPAEGQQCGVLPSHLCGTLGLCSASELR